MQLTTLVIGSLAALVAAAPAPDATAAAPAPEISVLNKCNFPVYVQEVPNNNAGPPGQIVRLPKLTGSFVRPYFYPAGAAIKLARSPDGFATPLTMEYTPSNNLVYYDISNNSGNPFVNFHNKLVPDHKACYIFNCDPHEANCYSNGVTPMVKTCPLADLKTVLCAN